MLKKTKINHEDIIILISFLSLIGLVFLIILNRDFKVIMKSNVINAGEDYKNTFSATYRGYDVTSDVKVASNIYDTSLGKYQITFTYLAGGKEYKVVKNVEIKDLDAPVIRLHANDELVLKLNSEYIEPGYSAVDNYDANITDKVEVSGNVDMTKAGVYEVKYSVKDSSNNKATAVRKINVLEKLPTEMTESEFTLKNLFEKSILKEKKSVTDKTMKKYVYIGDNDISLFSTYHLLDINNVWYNATLTLSNVDSVSVIIDGNDTKKTLYENIVEKNPKTIILSFGINSYTSVEDYIKKYDALVTKLQSISNARIVVMSFNAVAYKSNISMKKINDINYYLANMCSSHNIGFMYANESLSRDNDNYLSDGVTLSKKGMTIIYDYIKSHIRKGD